MTLESNIIKVLKKNQPGLLAIYLFGSANSIYETPESDVDIAVLMTEKLTIEKRLDIINDLIDSLHKDKIDLIDLKQASTVLKFQIMMSGQRIYCHEQFQVDTFEMNVFSDYVRLNEARQEILQAIQDRGSVL